jgi:hypothetical protein
LADQETDVLVSINGLEVDGIVDEDAALDA